VPVIIDDTPEATARVPDKFREVQWTRLVLTETPAAFARRMQELLGGNADAGRPRPGEREAAASPRKFKPSVIWTIVAPIVGLLIGLVYALKPAFTTRAARAPQVAAAAAAVRATDQKPTPAPPL